MTVREYIEACLRMRLLSWLWGDERIVYTITTSGIKIELAHYKAGRLVKPQLPAVPDHVPDTWSNN